MKVLIVDDNKTNLMIMSRLISKLDISDVREFENSVQALQWCNENDPDLVLLDYMMPDLDGLEFLARFRELPGKKETPVLMITAAGQKEIRYAALEGSANDFLNKPIDKAEFLARAKNMLAIRSSQKALSNRAEWLADEVRKATVKIREREREVIVRLSNLAEYRDPETGAHINRMAHFSRLIARNLGLSRADQDMLFEAAPMHDIGKVGIPDQILLNPGKLTPEEFAIMQEHTTIGYNILKDSPSPLLQAGAEIALGHHEKWDGSGYPNGKRGEEIPLFARICAVADVFDALTSIRPYKPAWEMDRAVELLQNSTGQHFDPSCVDAFLQDWDSVLAIRNDHAD